jgi:preprotein translocase subunit SecG
MNYWTLLTNFLLAIFVLVSILMILIILMQRSKQEGLGAAFGSSLTDSMFGAQTSNVLIKATSTLAVLFFILAISLDYLYSHQDRHSGLQQKLLTPAVITNAPAVTSTNAPAPAVETPSSAPSTTNAPASSTKAPAPAQSKK